jgi:threonine dehydrogenase-like Zn-dependent dehydrogenase
VKIPEWMHDEDAVLLTDAAATGYFGAQLGEIAEGDTVVVLGAGPVGLIAAQSAWLMGAGRVIVVDHLAERLEKARTMAHAETLDYDEHDDIVVELKKQTDFLGADVVIEAVGAEADGNCLQHVAGTKLKLQGGSPSRSTGRSTACARAAPSPWWAPTGRSPARSSSVTR